MREIFLGKPLHWGLVALAAGLLWWAGSIRAHVIHFNSFLIALCIGSVLIILILLKTTKPGEQVTRDELEEDEASDLSGGAAD